MTLLMNIIFKPISFLTSWQKTTTTTTTTSTTTTTTTNTAIKTTSIYCILLIFLSSLLIPNKIQAWPTTTLSPFFDNTHRVLLLFPQKDVFFYSKHNQYYQILQGRRYFTHSLIGNGLISSRGMKITEVADSGDVDGDKDVTSTFTPTTSSKITIARKPPHSKVEAKPNSYVDRSLVRRNVLFGSAFYVSSMTMTSEFASASTSTSILDSNGENFKTQQVLTEITDPETYSALLYIPPHAKAATTTLSEEESSNLLPPNIKNEKRQNEQKQQLYPLLFVLHGAAKNQGPIWNLSDIHGEHSGLPPSLLQAGLAPLELSQNFVMVAPYVGTNKQSFYDEPRSKILQFLNWFLDYFQKDSNNNNTIGIDPSRICLFGFSDGATLAVELLTTRKFAAGIIAAYGYTGILPQKALDRLNHIPMWIFHSKDDVIFPVECSDKLVRSLRSISTGDVKGEEEGVEIIRYSRFEKDQEGFTGRVRGHSTGITASKMPETYRWLLDVTKSNT